MLKIINKKRYDTDTARLCGSDSMYNPNDLQYWREDLFRKNTGEFFLYGEGGASSKYAKSRGQNQWSGGEMIIPLSVESARKWAEEHLSGDEYESIFGEVTESGDKRTVTFSLDDGTIEKLKRSATAAGISMSDYVADLIHKAYKG